MIDGPARDRKYGNEDKLPWQEKVINVQPRPHGRDGQGQALGRGRHPGVEALQPGRDAGDVHGSLPASAGR